MDPYASLRGGGRRSLRAEMLHRVNQGKFRVKDLPCSYPTSFRWVNEIRGKYIFKVDTDYWGNGIWELGLEGRQKMEDLAAETRYEVERVLGEDIAETGWLYDDWPEARRRYDRDDEDVRKLYEAVEGIEWT